MKNNRKSILLALDGSKQSMGLAKYVAEFLPPDETEVVLFHVMSRAPETLRDLGLNPSSHEGDNGVREWAAAQDQWIEEFMEEGRKAFLDAGFPSSAVKGEVRELKEGLARDIVAEALKGYDAIALGRQGVNPLEDGVLGSIASKIIVKFCRIPVWLIGDRPRIQKVLIAVDPSDSCMQAVDHVGKLLNRTASEVKLLHIVRGLSNSMPGYKKILLGDYLKKLSLEAEDKIRPIFEEAQDHLAAFGVAPERVFTKVISGVKSRAGAIFQEAVVGDYGTIVVGRRGLTRVQQYDMGRVSNKLVQMAKDRAVWIVGC